MGHSPDVRWQHQWSTYDVLHSMLLEVMIVYMKSGALLCVISDDSDAAIVIVLHYEAHKKINACVLQY